jgi:TrmH family RNA methyltransferase
MPTELGLHNPRIERLRLLQTSRGRREQGRFIVEGPTLIAEALSSGHAPLEIYAVAERLTAHPEIVRLEAPGVPLFTLPERAYARCSDVETPTGILAVLSLPHADPDAMLGSDGTIVLLAGLNDPGNAGTLVRSAEAFGATGVFFGRGGVDAFTPKVVRGAMGALFRLPIATVDADWLDTAAIAAGRPIVATDTDGEDLRTLMLPRRCILAIGNERRGVRDWLVRADQTIRIPHAGPTESLNAAVAGSIVLYVLAHGRLSCQ